MQISMYQPVGDAATELRTVYPVSQVDAVAALRTAENDGYFRDGDIEISLNTRLGAWIVGI